MPDRAGDEIVGFDPVESTFNGDRSFFDRLAPFVGEGTLHLGGDGDYFVGTFEDGGCLWFDRTPYDAQGWRNLGFDAENHVASLYAFEQASRRDPDDPLAWFNRLYHLMQLDRYEEARDIIGRVVDVAEEHHFDGMDRVYRHQALLEREAGHFDAADAAFDRALSFEPGLALDWYNKAGNFALAGRTEAALNALERATWNRSDYRDIDSSDEVFASIRDAPDFELLLDDGIRTDEPERREQFETRIDRIREMMQSGGLTSVERPSNSPSSSTTDLSTTPCWREPDFRWTGPSTRAECSTIDNATSRIDSTI